MAPPVHICSVATVRAPHTVGQPEAVALARTLFADAPAATFERMVPMFTNVHVIQRQVCEPPSWFDAEHTFTERNATYQRWALALSSRAGAAALAAADVAPSDVGAIIFVSTTGLATPSLDAQLLERLGLPARHTHRESMFGRGCAGGAAGLAQAADRARLLGIDRPVLLIVCELCSLTFRRRDASIANVISLALFGDGVAAAVLMAGDHAGPTVLGHDSVTWPATEAMMGWEFGDDGMTVTLAKSIPALVRREFATSVEEACVHVGVDRDDISHHLVHPGSAVVLDAVTSALGLGPHALDVSRHVLADHGNMSAATILFILDRFMRSSAAASGDLAALSAMGPGFSAEHVLLRW
jgi:alkylresorcinol/alkylpyrone synthase